GRIVPFVDAQPPPSYFPRDPSNRRLGRPMSPRVDIAEARAATWPDPRPTALLVLADGTVIEGHGIGAEGSAVGEVCFNTAMTGYQEILTDPSYAGQIITFTFPHIGNVGTNEEDIESRSPACRGLVLREDISLPANWRARGSLDEWLKNYNLTAIAGVDTRHLVSRIRDLGAPKGCLAFNADDRYDMAQLQPD